jgi:hypothetical protein
VKGRVVIGTLRQLKKFAPEDIIQAQVSGDLLCDIQAAGSSSIDIDFLKDENVSIRISEEIND